jgi:hypothetical protein
MCAVSLQLMLQQQQAERDRHAEYVEEYVAELAKLHARLWECRRGKPAPLRCGRKSRSHTAPAELADRVAARFDVGRSEAQRLCKAFALPYDEKWAPFPIARLCTTCELCPFKSASVGCLDAGVCARSAAVLRGLDADSFAVLYDVLPDEPAGPLGEFPPESFGQLLAEVRRHLDLSPGSPFRLPDVPRVACEPRPQTMRTHGPPRDLKRPPRQPQLGPATALGMKKGLRSLPATTAPSETTSTSSTVESKTETLKNDSTPTATRKPIAAPTARKPDHLYSFRRNPEGMSDGETWAEICAMRQAPSNGESLAKRINDRWELGGYHANQLCFRFDLDRDEREQRAPTSTIATSEQCPDAQGCIRDQRCRGFKNCRNGLQHLEKPQRLPALPPLPAHESDDIGPPSAS